jgi:hypothetical protein
MRERNPPANSVSTARVTVFSKTYQTPSALPTGGRPKPMAIDPHRRENLLEQATAYRRRLWLRLPVPASWLAAPQSNVIASQWCSSFSNCHTWELFLGCRRNGGWSLYFDIEPVLQFNPQGQLRRLYAAGQRYAADDGRLKLLQQPQLGGHMQFKTSYVDTAQTQMTYESCLLFLHATAALLQGQQYTVLGQFPQADENLLAESQQLFEQLSTGFTLASSAS